MSRSWHCLDACAHMGLLQGKVRKIRIGWRQSYCKHAFGNSSTQIHYNSVLWTSKKSFWYLLGFANLCLWAKPPLTHVVTASSFWVPDTMLGLRLIIMMFTKKAIHCASWHCHLISLINFDSLALLILFFITSLAINLYSRHWDTVIVNYSPFNVRKRKKLNVFSIWTQTPTPWSVCSLENKIDSSITCTMICVKGIEKWSNVT